MEDPKPAIMELISWILTLQVFFISAIWYLIVSHLVDVVVLPLSGILSHLPQTLPVRLTAYIYEHHIRAFFPEFPSVRQLLVWLRSVVLFVLPDPGPDPANGGTSSGVGSNPLSTLPVNLDAIRAGGNPGN
jgi:hypothetical protein